MKARIDECPHCKRTSAVLSNPRLTHECTEVYVAGYCPECGGDWTTVYHPRQIDIKD